MDKPDRPRADDCPCTQHECPIWGDCEACVRVHREHGRHLPECMEDILRGKIKDLAALVEYDVTDTRPTPEFWAQRKKDNQE